MTRILAAEVLAALICFAIVAPIEVGALTTCSCYNYTTRGETWDKNRESCKNLGHDLVSMETDDEWEFIKNAIQGKSTVLGSFNEWHIGLYKNTSTGNWTWVSGEAMTIDQWQPGEPGNNELEVVALIARHYPAKYFGKFNNVQKYDGRRAYICESVVTVNSAYCSRDCWTHPTTLPTISVTSSISPSKANSTSISPKENGSTTPFPVEPNSKPGSSNKPPVTLILAVVFGVLFVVVAVVLGLILLKLFRRSRKSRTKEGEPDENAGTNRDHQEPVDKAAPTLYQALGENRWEPSVMTYASLSEASREHNEAAGVANEDDRLLSPYETVEHTRKSGDNDYENMPNV